MKFFEGAERVFFIGIGGIGTSGLARLFAAHNKEVSGSDSTGSALTSELESEGIDVILGHYPENLEKGIDLVVYSEAIPLENPELEMAKEWGIPTMTYFQALGKLAESYRLVAVAGTHGKTTTVAMLALILINAGLDPNVIVGTKIKEFGNRNIRVGEGEILLVEACEYRRNFMNLRPDLLGILNIELDHVDYFPSFEDYENAFKDLAAQSKEVIWPDEISEYENELGVPGVHNLFNAGMAASLARRLDVSEEVISETLAEFSGTWRRFEYRGTANGALVYDDYAHHPSEIQATLQAAREKHPEAKIYAVFQPHQYSRTAQLLDAFAESFDEADTVIIPNIYEARDSDADKHAVSAEKLVDAIKEHHDDVIWGEDFDRTAEILLDEIGDGDLVIIMGAGDITHLIPMILDEGGVGMA